MYETKAQYADFVRLASPILENKGRTDLASFLGERRVRDLFLHSVDHPVGYQDGVSSISYMRMDRRTKKIADQRDKLYEIAEIAVTEVEDRLDNLGPKESKGLLLGANQLIQSARWNVHYYESNDKKQVLERLAKVYTQKVNEVERVKEWDAQILENKGFFHVGKLNTAVLASAATLIPSMITYFSVRHLLGDGTKEVMDSLGAVYFGSAVIAGFGQYPLLLLQDIFGDKKSPNTSKKLITNRQYSLSRHPLYASKFLGIVPGLNPFGILFAVKGAYHYSKACEFQDERMRILHGDEAIKYQEKTSAMIPGTNRLISGLKKLGFEKTANILSQPISRLLGKVPFIKNDDYINDFWETNGTYHMGEPNSHIATGLETKVTPNAFVQLIQSYAEGFKVISDHFKHKTNSV